MTIYVIIKDRMTIHEKPYWSRIRLTVDEFKKCLLIRL
jgi:hypothetical protein